jgi:hypothetical protein
MRIALAVLCIGAVMFLLRFLAALMTEAVSLPRSLGRERRQGKLVQMESPAQTRKTDPRTNRRIAL